MAVSLIVLLVFPIQARADDDGNYCSAQGYLAFDLRAAVTKGVQEPHILRLIRFGRRQGISPAQDVPIEDFQTHEMRCTLDSVFIAGWDHGYQSYLIEIPRLGIPKIVKHLTDPLRKFSSLDHTDAPTLGYPCRPGTIPLQSDDPSHLYELVITRSEKPMRRGVLELWKSELVEIGPDGDTDQRTLLSSGGTPVVGD